MKLKIILFSVAVILLAGCQSQSNAQLTETAQVTKISGAETLVATLTQTPEVTGTPTATITPTVTLTPATTTTPTQNIVFTLTPTTTGGENSSDCNRASFVEDVTIPDGTEMNPGESFTKTWRLENTGSCPWTTDYSVQFLNGIEMGGETVPIDAPVEPGETVDLSINFTAPMEPEIYASEWAIVNENGVAFEKSFYVQIEVTGNAAATQTP
ncbi:MAG: NBR1-Ig-like domain-containing protein [Anaerolineales bacterium]